MSLQLVDAKTLPSRYPTLIAACLGLWGQWLALRQKKVPWYRRAAIALQNSGHARLIEDHVNPQDPYLHRHFILGDDSSTGLRILIHQIHKSDRDGLHDHPWAFLSFGLEGLYREATQFAYYIRKSGRFYFRGARSFHRVELDPTRWDKPVWTMIITFPRMSKSWGFLTRIKNVVKWVHWKTWLSEETSEPAPQYPQTVIKQQNDHPQISFQRTKNVVPTVSHGESVGIEITHNS